jgi:hypothetical protein
LAVKKQGLVERCRGVYDNALVLSGNHNLESACAPNSVIHFSHQVVDTAVARVWSVEVAKVTTALQDVRFENAHLPGGGLWA